MTIEIEAQAFCNRVMRAGIPRGRDAMRAMHATLLVLGEYLDDPEKHMVGAWLPPTLAQWLRVRPFDRGADANSFFEKVAHLASLPVSRAHEDTQIVCSVIAHVIPPTVRIVLSQRLGPPLGALFELPEATEAPTHARHPSSAHHMLATGEAGSAHPLSESAPPSGVSTHTIGRASG